MMRTRWIFTLPLTIGILSNAAFLRAETRSFDGQGNNEKVPKWGMAGSQLQRFASTYYGDGMASMAGADRPSPRLVSNEVASQMALTQSARGLSDMTWCWGQFLDHDITLVVPSPDEFIPVMVEEGDPMAPMIPVMRSQSDPETGSSQDNPRQQMNSTTAFIDASNVYGPSAERATALRTHEGGTLIMGEGDLLPWNTAELEMENPNGLPLGELYMAGDVRANENPALISMHTLWLREHNRWANSLGKMHPDWTDEELYQHARRMVMGEMQNITFQEFLPGLLGPHAPALDEGGYDPEMNPQMFNEVSGALYRIGHTMVSAHIMKVRDDGSAAADGSFSFKDAFFQPKLVDESATVAEILKGVASKPMQEIDAFVVNDLRNFLFADAGHGGMDLISINLQRGRDHGLPSFNQGRAALGLTPYESFSEITENADVAQALERVYVEIDRVDLWIGAVAEDHLPGASVGETIAAGLIMQFEHLRDGDRFFFLWDSQLTEDEKAIIKATSLSDVIRRNTDVTSLQANVFMAPPRETWMDSDGDGVADISEVIAGTDPADAQSLFRLVSTNRREGFVVLEWASVQGKTYVTQQASSLDQPWANVGALEATEDTSRYEVPVLDGERERYYRVVVGR